MTTGRSHGRNRCILTATSACGDMRVEETATVEVIGNGGPAIRPTLLFRPSVYSDPVQAVRGII
jgi:hypothetical protein